MSRPMKFLPATCPLFPIFFSRWNGMLLMVISMLAQSFAAAYLQHSMLSATQANITQVQKV